MAKIGLCQFAPKLLKVEENLATMSQLLTGIKADLIILPELATSGYVFNTMEEVVSVAENTKTGKTARLFTQLASQNNCSYMVGIAENANGIIYNSAILVQPDGTIHTYRKTHLFNEEKEWFTPGDTGFFTVDLGNDLIVGMMICFDWIFPESARTLALKGATLIAQSANLVLPWCQRAMVTRSIENKVFTATVNRTGLEKNNEKELYFTGMSQLISPMAENLIQFDKNEASVKLVDIDLTLAYNKNVNSYNHVLNDRRESFYQ